MAPPATLRLGAVIDQLRKPVPIVGGKPMLHITLGICQGQIGFHDNKWQLHALYGAIVGVSPHDDRGPERSEVVFETADVDELIDRLVGELWTSSYGDMLDRGEKLRGVVTGVAFRVRLIARVQAGWTKPLTAEGAGEIVDGKGALDAKQARTLSSLVRELGGRITWTPAAAT